MLHVFKVKDVVAKMDIISMLGEALLFFRTVPTGRASMTKENYFKLFFSTYNSYLLTTIITPANNLFRC